MTATIGERFLPSTRAFVSTRVSPSTLNVYSSSVDEELLTFVMVDPITGMLVAGTRLEPYQVARLSDALIAHLAGLGLETVAGDAYRLGYADGVEAVENGGMDERYSDALEYNASEQGL